MREIPKIEKREKEETRSKRLNLLLKPSIHKAAQEKCDQLDISMNEVINQFLEKWILDGKEEGGNNSGS